ncbi:MAG: metal-sulfur cluster assembly factor [Weeksellaceae bacterium]
MKILNTESNDEVLCLRAFEDLYNVDDPEVGLNVVDLGLIYKLDFDKENKFLDVVITFTTEFCPMGESIYENISISLQDSFPDWKVDVNVSFEPPWEMGMISEAGQEFLGYY